MHKHHPNLCHHAFAALLFAIPSVGDLPAQPPSVRSAFHEYRMDLHQMDLSISAASSFEQREPRDNSSLVPGQIQRDDSDIANVEAIRALKQFGNGRVAIFAIEPDLLGGIIVSMQNLDRADVEFITNTGRKIYEDPPPDFAATVLDIAALESGARYRTFRSALAERLDIDPGKRHDGKLRSVYKRARLFVERRQTRPGRLYLVASSGRNPKPLALVGTKHNGSGKAAVALIIDGASLRTIFDGIYDNGFRLLEKEIAGRASSGRADDASRYEGLRQIWPEVRSVER